jgi:hypothetical protein
MFFTTVITLLGVSSKVEEREKSCIVKIKVVNRANKTVYAKIKVVVNSESSGFNVSSSYRGFKSFYLYKVIYFNVTKLTAVLISALRSVKLTNVLTSANRVSITLIVFVDNARGCIISFSSVATSTRFFLRGVFVSSILISLILISLITDYFLLA